jgi:hypothetical protein
MNKYIATTQILHNVTREHTLYAEGNLECHNCRYNKYLIKEDHTKYICSFLSVFGRKVEITSYVLQHYDPRPEDCPFELMEGEI